MNREETKKKLVEELKKEMAPIEYGGDREHAPEVHYPTEDEIAEALIEAGVRFTESLTVTFNKMDLLREHQLVCRLANAEHRAEVAEMGLKKFAENITCEDCPFFSDCASSEKMEDLMHSNYCFAEYLKQAEKELAEEGKDD